MAKRVFVKGELLGTFGTKFVEELPQETVGKKKRRMCICECGICHNLYTTQLRMDKKIDTEYVKNILTKYINIKFERGVEK